MNGFRVYPKGHEEFSNKIDGFINSYIGNSEANKWFIAKKIKWWKMRNGPLTKNKLSGFLSFIIQETKVG